ncbi:hypothetical protein ACFQ3C_05350 [Seohaeicola saemankumensis]|uniref:Uncharacterized protein n=1 Tax=Seohaeicola saemankumensis TaxID=481181 RepID=A0ABW3TC09_9RHOB|nr:hypothetical protein [Paracoccaceae bacterium]
MKKHRRHAHRVKPALIKSPLTYVVADGAVICEDASGNTLWRIEMAAVHHAHWTASRAGQSLTRILRLDDGTQARAIRQHLYRRALLGGPDDMAFRACITDVLRALMAAQPGLDVQSGPSAVTSVGLRVLGVVLLAGACAAPFLALATGQDLMAFVNWAIPVTLIGLLGLALMRTYAAGRRMATRTPAELIAELEQV